MRVLPRERHRPINAARAWIAREGLEGVICFNGRMEATRAICEAARDAGVPFVSVERTGSAMACI